MASEKRADTRAKWPGRGAARWLWVLPPIGLILLVLASLVTVSGTPLSRFAHAIGGPDHGKPSLTATRHAASPPAIQPLVAPVAGRVVNGQYLFTPDEVRAAYRVRPLIEQGIDGRGQTVVVVVSFGNPNLMKDLATFDAAYHLPPADVRVISPLGETPFDPTDVPMDAWSREVEEDVETIHAIAPGAKIVVLTSPAAQNQGTDGLSNFLNLERYAVDNHLGAVISQSWGASEATLDTPDGRAQIAEWHDFYRDATAKGVTFLASSGDHGVTDFGDGTMTKLSRTPTTNFPASDPFVTAVGGTSLQRIGDQFIETAWDRSGGGISRFFAMPPFQVTLPAATQAFLAGRRGVPDVAALGENTTGLGIFVNGEWHVDYGTSASTPLWAALVAIANQQRGRPLGNINPLLYQIAATPGTRADFTDLLTGDNGWIGNGYFVPGYRVGPGWDAVTGLGTPRADMLIPDLIVAANRRDVTGSPSER